MDAAAPETEVMTLAPAAAEAREGFASWYGPKFHGRLTACGEVYDQDALTAAHRTLPFGTLLAVTNLDTGCSVMLRVNDRGPYHGARILDCSKAGAEELGFIEDGVARIKWEIIDPASIAGPPVRKPAPRPAARAAVASAAIEPPRPINSEEASW
jgi:rare lipoprotein A